MSVVCAGEALMDLVAVAESQFEARPGGCPMLVAVVLSRLGVPSHLWTRLSLDGFGRRLLRHLRANGVSERHLLYADRPTSLAVVTLEADEPSYAFYTDGTATFDLGPADVPALDHDTEALFFGSLASFLEPVASATNALVERESGTRILFFDPNVRPALMPPRPDFMRALTGYVSAANVVKASVADLAWISGGTDPADTAREWLELGPELVVSTRDRAGAMAFGRSATAEAFPQVVATQNTVGAGDAFSAGLISWMREEHVLRPGGPSQLDQNDLRHMLIYAASVASGHLERSLPRAVPLGNRDRVIEEWS